MLTPSGKPVGTNPSGSPVRNSFLIFHIKRYLSYLPRLYRGRPSGEAPSEFSRIVDPFNIPLPSSLVGRPDPGCGRYNRLIIFCPHTFFRELAPYPPRCPYCESDENVRLNGFVPGATTMIGPEGHVAVVARRYRCLRCVKAKPGKSSRYFSALHEDILKQLDPSVQHALPFRAFKRKLVHKSVLHMTTSLRLSGVGFTTIARALRWALSTQHIHRWLSYNCRLMWMKKQGSLNIGQHQSYGEFCAPVVGEKLLKTLWRDDHLRRKEDTLAFLSTFYSNVLKWDHTFWSTKHVREQGFSTLFAAQFGVAGGDGSILGSAFTRTKGMEEPSVRSVFDSILERSNLYGHPRPKLGYSDQASNDEAMIRRVWGDQWNIQVKSDAFHVILNYESCVKSTGKYAAFKKEFARDISNVSGRQTPPLIVWRIT